MSLYDANILQDFSNIYPRFSSPHIFVTLSPISSDEMGFCFCKYPQHLATNSSSAKLVFWLQPFFVSVQTCVSLQGLMIDDSNIGKDSLIPEVDATVVHSHPQSSSFPCCPVCAQRYIIITPSRSSRLAPSPFNTYLISSVSYTVLD